MLSALSETRKKELILHCGKVLQDLDLQAIKGTSSLVQEILNRIESVSSKVDEYKYMVDVITYLLLDTKGKEMEILYRGRPVSKEMLAKDFGIFLTPKIKP